MHSLFISIPNHSGTIQIQFKIHWASIQSSFRSICNLLGIWFSSYANLIHITLRFHWDLIQISCIPHPGLTSNLIPIPFSVRSRLYLIQIIFRFHSEIIHMFMQILLTSHSAFIQISYRAHPDPFQISFTFSQYDSVPWNLAVRIGSAASHYELVPWEPRTTN